MNWAKRRILVVFSLLAALMIAGCTNDTASVDTEKPAEKPAEQPQEEQVDANFAGLSTFLSEANSYLNSGELSIHPTEVYKKVILEKDPSYQVIDIRDEATFGNGNIEGSFNIPYGQSTNMERVKLLPKDKKLIIVCFSGHTAAHTASFWNMLGYDAIPMQNGMGGWTDNPNLGAPIQAEPFNLPVDTADVAKGSFDLPTMPVTDAKDLEELLVLGSKAYFANGYGAVKPAPVIFKEVVQEKSDAAMIVDIRSNEDYKKGHVEGAINIPYTEIANEESLKALDPSKQIILIDYNGSIASEVTRILSIVGYEAYPIKDGMRIWTSDEKVNGIPPISAEKIYNYPVSDLNVNLDAEAGEASCS